MCSALWRSSSQPRMSGRYIKAVTGRTVDDENRRGKEILLPRRAPSPKRSNVRERRALLALDSIINVGNDLRRASKENARYETWKSDPSSARNLCTPFKGHFDSSKSDVLGGSDSETANRKWNKLLILRNRHLIAFRKKTEKIMIVMKATSSCRTSNEIKIEVFYCAGPQSLWAARQLGTVPRSFGLSHPFPFR